MKQILSKFRIFLTLGVLVLMAFSSPSWNKLSAEPASLDSVGASSSDEAVDTDDTTGEADELPEPTAEPTTNFTFTSELIIKAINPGYSVNGQRDVGELIELQKTTTDTSLSLAGYSVQYSNSSGTSTTLLDFSEGSSLTGEFLLLRLARSPGSERADATYATTLAMGGGSVTLLYDSQVVDSVCWSSADSCVKPFKSSDPTTLVRSATDGKFYHQTEVYTPHYDPDRPALIVPVVPPVSTDASDASQPSSPANPADDTEPEPEPAPETKCKGVEFSEVFAYYADDKSEQFVELYNSTDHSIDLGGCKLRYKKKVYHLSGNIIADGYYAFYPNKATPSFSFTKNPSTSNSIELLDTDDTPLDNLVYSHGQKKSTAFARFYDAAGDEFWRLTYAPTPGSANAYQEFRSCPAGKVINPTTGNCVKVVVPSETTTTDCPAGKYRNPLTGRCKKIESEAEPKPCKAGYERNPDTGRCRKIKTATSNDGAEYALVPTTYSSKSTFVALGITILIVSLGVVYIILQFRHEIARAARKIRQRCNHIRKDLIARGISFRRNKKP